MGSNKRKISLSPKLRIGVGRGYGKPHALKFVTMVCILLAIGLIGNAIKLLGNTSKASINPQVAGTSIATNQQITPTQIQAFQQYEVKSGETLFSISQKIHTPWTILAQINKLDPPFTLKAGQKIQIPNN